METKIKWSESNDYITATYNGSGNETVLVSSDINEGIDRQMTINVKTTQGTNQKTKSIVVSQLGLREVFSPSDGSFILADGGTYNVKKNGL